jgi:hypothetical protein
MHMQLNSFFYAVPVFVFLFVYTITHAGNPTIDWTFESKNSVIKGTGTVYWFDISKIPDSCSMRNYHGTKGHSKIILLVHTEPVKQGA